MTAMLRSVIRSRNLNNVNNIHKRNLWEWINMMFNSVDPERVKSVGPDKACAEWLLRNGGKVSWKNGLTTDNYNLLPKDTNPNSLSALQLAVIDATNSSISHYGFEHLKGCKHIEKIILDKCKYIDDKAIEGLSFCESPLIFLQISQCPNVTDKGLQDFFPHIPTLRTLILKNLEEVDDLEASKKSLQKRLPDCDIQIN